MFVMVAALAWVVTACSEDEAVISNNENLIKEISLSIEGSDTRMAYEATAAGLKFSWEDGDPVYVFPAETDNHTQVAFTYDSNTGKFISGTGLEEGKKYYAIRGNSQIGDKYNVGGVSAALTLSSIGSLTNLPMVSDIFTATADGTFSTLHHTCGVVEIPFTGTGTLDKVQFNAYNSTEPYVRGNFTVSFTDEKVGTITKGDLSNYKYIYENTTYDTPLTLTSTPQSLFIPLLPGTYNNVIIYNNDGVDELAKGLSVTVERGKVHKKSTAINVE
mgnify:FL=1